MKCIGENNEIVKFLKVKGSVDHRIVKIVETIEKSDRLIDLTYRFVMNLPVGKTD